MQFKTERQKQEFNDPRLDVRVRYLLFLADGYSLYYFKKEAVVTEIYRPDEEHWKIYMDSGLSLEEAKKKPNIHGAWRAGDLRYSIYTPEEANKMDADFNKHIIYSGGKQTSLLHKVGSYGMHFHLQADPDGITELKA